MERTAEVISEQSETAEAEITITQEEKPAVDGSFTHVDEELAAAVPEEPVETGSPIEPTAASHENEKFYRQLMQRAAERSAEAGGKIVKYTLDEIQVLLMNDEFCSEQPDLADQFLEILQYPRAGGLSHNSS